MALIHLQPAQAFADNPLVFLGLVMLPVLALFWAVEALGGPAVRPPVRLANWSRRIHPSRWLAGFVLLGLADTLVRNLF